jgi:acetyl-CoA carboxylase carboxyltransferase component
MQRLETLCDPGSMSLVSSQGHQAAPRRGYSTRTGAIGAWGSVNGRPVALFAQDASVAGGSLGEAESAVIVQVLALARDERVPVIGFVESAGARIHEGVRALAGYGRIFRMNVALSRLVPQISVITGVSAGGGCYAPALTDFVIMTSRARMFLTGPDVVAEVTGEQVTQEELGGTRVHGRNGVCDVLRHDDLDATAAARELLSFLPQSAGHTPPRARTRPPSGADPGASMPSESSRIYDVREVVSALTDAGEMLELCPRWARNMVTGLARLDGRTVGVVANQPRYLGGAIDVAASAKASRFIETCDAFGIPLMVLVDTPGFVPGTRQEHQAIIRQGARLLRAFAAASVPKVTVILRKAYGGGCIAMNSKDLGADFVLAWPQATIGVLGARQAVKIIHRREIADAREPGRALDLYSQLYAAQHESPAAASRAEMIDAIVEPAETRARLCAALGELLCKRGSSHRAVTLPPPTARDLTRASNGRVPFFATRSQGTESETQQ